MTQIDYLLIGHITCDLIPEGSMVGGTVSYSGRLAEALGYHTAVLTSCAPDYEGLDMLANLEVVNVPAAVTSTFENVYTEDGRIQILHDIASPITVEHLPERWQNPGIVHLAPLTDEVDVNFVRHFPDSLICLTPQGWMREWDEDGRVRPKVWEAASEILPLADIVILSQEDLINTEMLWRYWEWAPLLVLTGGPKGCIVIQGETAFQVPTILVNERESTGAGDIFATAYFIRFHQTGDPVDAARFANYIASHSVTRVGIDAVEKKIKRVVKSYE